MLNSKTAHLSGGSCQEHPCVEATPACAKQSALLTSVYNSSQQARSKLDVSLASNYCCVFTLSFYDRSITLPEAMLQMNWTRLNLSGRVPALAGHPKVQIGPRVQPCDFSSGPRPSQRWSLGLSWIGLKPKIADEADCNRTTQKRTLELAPGCLGNSIHCDT
eukprot:TRINITY_DN46555_c0_g1_i1.p1 TRINITY_DN46555_c0_g1~~TRINITY_DN46555_c0_g1_i1.p1  ORF type:complete len:162 (+),score=12.67 TRINITY_DN46555_c0_g1_i1:101-586(+)